MNFVSKDHFLFPNKGFIKCNRWLNCGLTCHAVIISVCQLRHVYSMSQSFMFCVGQPCCSYFNLKSSYVKFYPVVVMFKFNLSQRTTAKSEVFFSMRCHSHWNHQICHSTRPLLLFSTNQSSSIYCWHNMIIIHLHFQLWGQCWSAHLISIFHLFRDWSMPRKKFFFQARLQLPVKNHLGASLILSYASNIVMNKFLIFFMKVWHWIWNLTMLVL